MAWTIDDFPAPVRPTIATFYPGYIEKLMSSITKGSPSLYLIERFYILIELLEGH